MWSSLKGTLNNLTVYIFFDLTQSCHSPFLRHPTFFLRGHNQQHCEWYAHSNDACALYFLVCTFFGTCFMITMAVLFGPEPLSCPFHFSLSLDEFLPVRRDVPNLHFLTLSYISRCYAYLWEHFLELGILISPTLWAYDEYVQLDGVIFCVDLFSSPAGKSAVEQPRDKLQYELSCSA